MKTVENNLETRLENEEATLRRVDYELASANSNLETIARELAKAKQALAEDEENALIEARKPDNALARKVEDLDFKHSEAQRQWGVYARARQRQEDTVTALRREIEAGRHERFLAEIEKPAKDLNRVIDELVKRSVAVAEILNEYRQPHNWQAVIAPPVPADPSARFLVRAAKLEVMNAALRVHAQQLVYVGVKV